MAYVQGSTTGASSSGQAPESELWTEFSSKVAALKGAVVSLQKLHSSGQMLLGDLKVAARSDEALKAKAEAFEKMFGTLQDTVAEINMIYAEHRVRRSTDEKLAESLAAVQNALVVADTHIVGYKDAAKRFSAMISV